MTESPLSKLGDLTKPATVLIEKISDAVGGVFKPYQVIRVAKAEAEAERIRAESEVQVTDIHRRALRRFLKEEAQRQSNMENLTAKALPHLEDDATPQQVSDDWIANFFDKSRLTSDSDMQELWARVLAGEANVPGAFSRKTVNLLADLDKVDAELFANLCGFAWVIQDVVPLIHNLRSESCKDRGISFDSLGHLESLGFVRFNDLTGFQRIKLPKRITAHYHSRSLQLTFPKDTDNTLDLGKVLLTRAGQELAQICESEPVEGFFESMRVRWEKNSLIQ